MVELLGFYLALLAIAVLAERTVERVGLPYPAFLVLAGFAASEFFTAVGGDTGLRWEVFHDLVFFVFLPVLIFEAAFNIDGKRLLENLAAILYLAVPLMLLATGVTAAIVYIGIGHPAGFPWLAALLAGALLSATDPAAVLALFKRVGAPERLRILVDGESLFNDATAVILFSLFVTLASGEGGVTSGMSTVGAFLITALGGAFAGGLAAMVAHIGFQLVQDRIGGAVVMLVCAYGAFVLAEAFHVSGIMAVLVAGLSLGHRVRREDLPWYTDLWEYKAKLANTLLLLIAGISFQWDMFADQWLAMLIAIGAVSVARALNLLVLLPAFERIPRIEPIPARWRPVLFLGGLRGAVTLALALSVPLDLPYWWTVQSMAYGVVLWTLLLQSSLLPWVLRKLAIGR